MVFVVLLFHPQENWPSKYVECHLHWGKFGWAEEGILYNIIQNGFISDISRVLSSIKRKGIEDSYFNKSKGKCK